MILLPPRHYFGHDIEATYRAHTPPLFSNVTSAAIIGARFATRRAQAALATEQMARIRHRYTRLMFSMIDRILTTAFRRGTLGIRAGACRRYRRRASRRLPPCLLMFAPRDAFSCLFILPHFATTTIRRHVPHISSSMTETTPPLDTLLAKSLREMLHAGLDGLIRLMTIGIPCCAVSATAR